MVLVAGYVSLGVLDDRPGIATAPASAPSVSAPLDPTFGDTATPGTARLPATSGYRTVVQTLPLPDGTLVLNVAATDLNGLPTAPFGLARLDQRGRLDSSFGDAATPGFAAAVEATAMAVDGGGRVLLATAEGIRRYTATGQVDTSFVRTFPVDVGEPPPPSTPGQVNVRGTVRRILVGDDGSIVVAGSGHPADGYSTVTRLLPDGDYDPSFGDVGTPGMLTLPFTPVIGPVPLADGRLAVAPHGPTIPVGTPPATPSRARMYVITSDGVLDPAVGGGSGIVDLGPPGIAVVDLVRSGERLLLTGREDGAFGGLLLATDLDGVLDPTWGVSGRLAFAELGQQSATIVRWPDRDAVGLEFVTAWDAPRRLVRLTDDGRLDGSFGNDPHNPGWLVLELAAPQGAGHWLAFRGLDGGAVVGAGREGLPPPGGVLSVAEVVRTLRYDGAPDPRPARPYVVPPPPTSTLVPATTHGGPTTVPPASTTTTTTVGAFRIDGGADVGAGAVRVRP